MRYVMRIAEFRESSSFWTQIALCLAAEHASLSVGLTSSWLRIYLRICQARLLSILLAYGLGVALSAGEELSVLASGRKKSDVDNSSLQWDGPIRYELFFRPVQAPLNLWFFGSWVWLRAFTVCVDSITNYRWRKKSPNRPQMKREDPVNLSILLTGGKETNKDSPSNGEWSGKSSNWKSGGSTPLRIVV
jgi:hypothetical protein